MNIALDARWIFPEISGIGAYTRELIREFARCDREHRYTLIFGDAAVLERTAAETGFGDAPNIAAVTVPYGLFSPAGQLRLPLLLRRHAIDVYHSPNYMMPLWAGPSRARRVVTIHDLIPMLFREQVRRSKKARMYPLYRRLMLAIGARADMILTDSRASADDIVRLLRIPPERRPNVRAIPCGVSARFRPAPRRDTAPQRERILLYVGRADPYKNLEVLVDAFARARRATGLPMRLVVAGSPDPRYPEAAVRAGAFGVADAVRWTGYLADEELVNLYQQADVLVHPSRYEGFGLQVLEAMACGLPVVCSNAAALPEVAGDAARLADPDNAGSFADHIARVLTDAGLAADLAARGLRRAAQFTWESTAQRTLAAYADAAAMP